MPGSGGRGSVAKRHASHATDVPGGSGECAFDGDDVEFRQTGPPFVCEIRPVASQQMVALFAPASALSPLRPLRCPAPLTTYKNSQWGGLGRCG